MMGEIQRGDIEIDYGNILHDKDNLLYIWCNKRERIFKTKGDIQYYNKVGEDKIPKIRVYFDETKKTREIRACKCYGINLLPKGFDYNQYVQCLKKN